MDLKTYRKYKRRIAQAVAKVDNKPPKFEVDTYYKKRNMIIDMNRTQQLDRDNMDLLRRMNIIVRLGGNVDCWLPKIKYTSNLPNPDIINKSHMKNNKILLQKIRSVGSYYPAGELIQSWKEAKKKTQHRQRQSVTILLSKDCIFSNIRHKMFVSFPYIAIIKRKIELLFKI
ncbi:hypothetical protein WH47_03693 [Habropoda laboriosa]|uniref:Uncharacterized protein n=1 Tax=Habropoda laboriosa TaxID=597456 RepID=A0A0L7RI63_9HYME|nr:hypothetical protein WH47_03693 [Habropoda laboriosa]